MRTAWIQWSGPYPISIFAVTLENQQSAYAKTKTQISFAVTAKLISAFVFATWIVHFLFFLNPKFQVSSHLLCLYSLVCVGPVRKPRCWFSHKVAHICCDIGKCFFFFCCCFEYSTYQKCDNMLSAFDLARLTKTTSWYEQKVKPLELL